MSFLFDLVTIPILIWLCRRALALKPLHYLILMGIFVSLSLWLMKSDIAFLRDYGRLSKLVCSMEGFIMGIQLIPHFPEVATSRKEMPMYCFVSKNWIFSAKDRAKREAYLERK
ncbi:hypothetical protein PcPA57_05150 [Pasteurella canis]|uniref:hypothetical protein n=1 Tax=Pasteurella canis TaxID=753 RepID=UPI001E4B34F9|nr:hypothetical protein [Pasteurella canis]GJJ79795.1 hypothetical protein PcPA57_05150 [Pasteurella canis]